MGEYQYITFSKIHENDLQLMAATLNIFKEYKTFEITSADYNNADREEIIKTIGEIYNTKFWHPTDEELDAYNIMCSEYSKLSYDEKRNKHIAFFNKITWNWDFDSWVCAILDADIKIYGLIENDNNNRIVLEQMAYPSGGIEAMEYLVKIYGGEIISNDMV